MTTPIKIGINGFGRIGRKIARLALANDNVEIVGINDLGNLQTLAHLFKYDSIHGKLQADVRTDGEQLVVDGKKIRVTAERDPSALAWKDLGATFVHESTGVFTKKEKAGLHLQAGAKKVIISAPSPDPDITLCMGVNHREYRPGDHQIISNASCTTNCLAPLVKALDDSFSVVRGTMLTIHSYTNDQRILDLPHKDLRRARAAAVNQIPTTTGAAKAVGLVLPHLKGKLDGMAIRVPTPNVSVVDFTGELKKTVAKDEANQALKKASESGDLAGILGYSEEPLVSGDFNGTSESSIVDAQFTTVVEGNMIKCLSWYDNESGFSNRMIDLTLFIAQQGL